MASNGDAHYDVIVIGGGFSGVTAGRDLSEQGYSVLLLESRDRLGGRTWNRNFADTDRSIEMGGAYIYPDRQINLMAEMERYGLEIEHSPPAQSYPTLLAGQHRPGPMPVPDEEIFDLERAVYQIVKDASRIEIGIPLDRQGVEDLDIPWSEYLSKLDIPTATREYLGVFPGLYMANYPHDASTLQLLSFVAQLDHSMIKVWGVLDAKIKGGTKRLLDAIADDLEGEIRLEAPVESVVQDNDGVTVTTRAGDVFTAKSAVIATPMAKWVDIEFEPVLSEDKQAASVEQHVAWSGKVWAQVKNAPPFPYAIASPESCNGVVCISTEYDLGEEGQIMVGFLVRDPENPDRIDNSTFAGTEQFVKTLFPDAEVVKFDSHDWVADPHSKGDWIAYSAGRLSKSHSRLGLPEGRLYFATSDIALGYLSWMDGAIEMGHKAAATAMREMAREAVAVQVRS